MSLGISQKEMEKAAAIAAVLQIIADEVGMLEKEIGFDHESMKIKSAFEKLRTNLELRVDDYIEASKPQPMGDVKIVQREKG